MPPGLELPQPHPPLVPAERAPRRPKMVRLEIAHADRVTRADVRVPLSHTLYVAYAPNAAQEDAMFGRFILRAERLQLGRAFRLEERRQIPRNVPLRLTIAPSQAGPIVRKLRIVRRAGDGAVRELAAVRWGLIPAWAKEPSIGNKMINARAESVAEKPAFRAAFRSRRCIVPASGFYEWQRRGRGPARPYLIRRKDGDPL